MYVPFALRTTVGVSNTWAVPSTLSIAPRPKKASSAIVAYSSAVSAALAAGSGSELAWTAPRHGTLSISGKVPSGKATLSLAVDGVKTDLTIDALSVEVSKGSVVKVSVLADADLAAGEAGLKTLVFVAKNEAPVFADDTVSSVTSYLKFDSRVPFVAESAVGEVAYSSKGLPDGMRISKKGNLIGTPEKAGTYQASIIASNDFGSTTQAVEITVGAFPAKYKGTYCGIVFDSTESMVASVSWKIAANGKWSATIEKGGKKTKEKDVCEIDAAGCPVLAGETFSASIASADADVWAGG